MVRELSAGLIDTRRYAAALCEVAPQDACLRAKPVSGIFASEPFVFGGCLRAFIGLRPDYLPHIRPIERTS